MPARATILACAAAVLAGCGEPREDVARTVPTPLAQPAARTAGAVATVEVSLVDYRLQPAKPRVPLAGKIAFVATNDGQARHALRVDGPAGEVSSVMLRPGERATIALRLPPGTYKWYCPLADHERRGMVGRVRVAE